MKSSYITGTGTEDVYVPKLWYYEHLLFLDEKDVTRPGRDDLSDEGDDNEKVSKFWVKTEFIELCNALLFIIHILTLCG